jgi:hypothetical protein
MDLTNAVVYDIETLPNVFLITMELLHAEHRGTWEISEYRDDRESLLATFYNFARLQIPMIGFNNNAYDYPVIHYLYHNPGATYADLYRKSRSIFATQDRFIHRVWDNERFCPQIDLFQIHHFDNVAKRTSLKALEINMRSPVVMESPLPFDVPLTRAQIDNDLIPYNHNDTSETKRFAHYSLPAINFRIGLMGKLGRHSTEPLNYNDTKVGERMLEERLGESVCYEWREYDVDFQGTKKRERVRRSTVRSRIDLAQIIFPYIRFENPEFQRVLDFMKAQVLKPDELYDPYEPAQIKTKGVFKDLTANVGGLQFVFGTGGVHASVERQRFAATETRIIRDIDVEALYPSIAIVNKLAPAHLGDKFIGEYSKIPQERKQHAKGTYQNAALKLAANGAWGKSNSPYSVFYDAQYAMTIPINGQLMICMLAEQLLKIPTLQIIQANTDGITYAIDASMEPYAVAVCKWWEQYTCLKLEAADYNRMWIRDVNNYLAEDTKGKLKQKGAYWHPDPNNYADSISNHSPPCWYKDLGNVASTRAAVAHMVHGFDLAMYLMVHAASGLESFDYMLRAKASAGAKLMLGERYIQKVSRYYVAVHGEDLFKVNPPPEGYKIGDFKRAQGVSHSEYWDVMKEHGAPWNAAVCTKNQSRYADTKSGIDVGWKVVECNDARRFDWNNVNYQYYIQEARKLVI